MTPEERAYLAALAGFPSRIEREFAILLYHGVTAEPSRGIENASGKHMPVDEFRRQMAWLRQNCAVLPLAEVVSLVAEERPLPRRAVVVTFDDGFRNNYAVAAPVLHELGMPATFYVCAGVVNTDLMFWVDALEDCLNLTTVASIGLRLGAEDVSFPLRGDTACLTALQRIKAYCKVSAAAEKDRVVAAVMEETGVVPAVAHAPNYAKIAWSELREMDRDPLFTIGGHSLYHDILSARDERQMRDDVIACQTLLRHNLGHDIRHFSYPEGQASHYNDGVIAVLREAGVVCSPSAICGLNASDADPFHFRRIMPGIFGLPFPYWDERLSGSDARSVP